MEDKFVKETCKPNTLECCRYLMMSAKGWECGKLTEMKSVFDIRVAKGEMRAIGDNCEGKKLEME